MTTTSHYALSDILNASTSCSSSSSASSSSSTLFDSREQSPFKYTTSDDYDDQGFDNKLRHKLLLPSSSSRDGDNDGLSTSPNIVTNENDADYYDDDAATFDTVRTLFRTAARALQCELRGGSGGESSGEKSARAHCHWMPGRIEVMGKHTDYAGGNSLVCATARRGMAFVSTFIEDGDMAGDCHAGHVHNRSRRSIKSNTADGYVKKMMKVTIVSVIRPPGMERTTAPYKEQGRKAVRHAIIISGEQIRVVPEEGEDRAKNNWTRYPTAVIKRLHHNFGLVPCGRDAGGHLIVAISSNLPPASGLSTSSALVTGMFAAVDSHFHLSTSERYRNAIGDEKDKNTLYNLSTYLGNIENGRDYIRKGVLLEGIVHGGVGTFGGSEDHAAILLGERGELRLLSFCPTRPACIDGISVTSNLSNDDNQDEEFDVALCPIIVGKIGSVIRLPADVTFVIAYSGVKAEKAGGADGDSAASIGYNSASELARCALNAYLAGCDGNASSERIDDIQTLADAVRWERELLPSASFSEIRCDMSRHIMAGASSSEDREEEYSKLLVKRFVHFYNESECFVPAAAYALSQKKYDLLGHVVDASHRGAVNLLKNQTEETAWLPLWARGKEHTLQLNSLLVMGTQDEHIETNKYRRVKALAASAFGAGYGGSCWALVYRHEAHEFARQWQAAFEERFPQSKQCSDVAGEFFVADPGPGAFRV